MISIPPKSLVMKKVVFYSLILFSLLNTISCTNDEGDDDIDLLTPNVEEEALSKDVSEKIK